MTSIYRKLPHYFFFLVFGTAFAFFSVESAVLSEQWAVLSLREIDDFALLSSIYRLFGLFQSGSYRGCLAFFDYAYGNAFWLSNLALLYPFIKTNSPQVVIIAAREITLISGFLSLYFVYKISYRFTGKVGFSYFAALLTLTMPAFVYWIQKFHVDIESMLLGLIAYYLLIRKDKLEVSALRGSAVLGGLAIGFKLTGVLLLPVLGLTALYRLWSDPLWQPRRKAALVGYAAVTGLTAIAATAPVLLIAPISWGPTRQIIATFFLFQKLGATLVKVDPGFLLQAVGDGTVTVVGLGVVFAGLLIWSWRKDKLDPLPLILFAGIGLGLVAVTLVVRKGPLYSAAYFINMTPFLVFGFVPLARIRSAIVGPLACLAVFIAIRHELLMPLPQQAYANYQEMMLEHPPELQLVPAMTHYFTKAREPEIQRDLDDLREMAEIIPKPSGSINILRDFTSVFPYTIFDKGVTDTLNYATFDANKNKKYDYIIINKNNWSLPNIDRVHETESRNELLVGGSFGGRKYKNIYDGRNNVIFIPGDHEQ